jgi:hypothetical protein
MLLVKRTPVVLRQWIAGAKTGYVEVFEFRRRTEF